jgi:hypothetical protein
VIEREADRKTPSGVIQENAFRHRLQCCRSSRPKRRSLNSKAGEASYIANGFTTVQDGKTDLTTLKTLSAV